MVGSSRICERVVTHQSIGYTHRSRTFPKACISTSSAVRRGRLCMQKEELSRGGGRQKLLTLKPLLAIFERWRWRHTGEKTLRIFRFFGREKGRDGKCSWWETPFEAFSVNDPPPLSASLFHLPAFFVF